MSPEAAERLMKAGFKINVESGAGDFSDFHDSAFEKVGCSIVNNDAALQSDLVFKVRGPNQDEANKMRNEAGLISFIQPAQNQALVDTLK